MGISPQERWILAAEVGRAMIRFAMRLNGFNEAAAVLAAEALDHYKADHGLKELQ